jgi:hypothetical protein
MSDQQIGHRFAMAASNGCKQVNSWTYNPVNSGVFQHAICKRANRVTTYGVFTILLLPQLLLPILLLLRAVLLLHLLLLLLLFLFFQLLTTHTTTLTRTLLLDHSTTWYRLTLSRH